jgi:hypothetical protein
MVPDRVARRNRAGPVVPARPAAALLLAAGVVLIWLGLPFGAWLPMTAVAPLVAALAMEIATRRSSRG